MRIYRYQKKKGKALKVKVTTVVVLGFSHHPAGRFCDADSLLGPAPHSAIPDAPSNNTTSSPEQQQQQPCVEKRKREISAAHPAEASAPFPSGSVFFGPFFSPLDSRRPAAVYILGEWRLFTLPNSRSSLLTTTTWYSPPPPSLFTVSKIVLAPTFPRDSLLQVLFNFS